MRRPGKVASTLTSALALVAVSAVVSPPANAGEVTPHAAVREPPPSPEIGLGLLQLAAGYALEVGGVVGLAGAGLYPKSLGFRSDAANAMFVGVLAPVLAGTAVCTTGLLSSRYRGRCGKTILGAYAGAAFGALLGILVAPAPGPDDTDVFVKSIYAVAGFFVFAPIGAVVGYHVSKDPIARDGEQKAAPAPVPVGAPAPAAPPTADASSSFGERARSGALGNAPPRLMLPVLSLAW